MNNETESEAVEREWEPFSLVDGECHIPDLTEFYEDYDAMAVAFIDGVLYVLQRGGTKWLDVCTINAEGIKKTGTVSAFPGGRTNGPKRVS